MSRCSLSALKWLLPIAILVGGSACNRYYYRPNSVNAPLLRQQGDVHIVADFFTDEVTTEDIVKKKKTLDVHIAASPLNHLGIIGGYSNFNYYRSDGGDWTTGDVNARANLWEAGIGGYYNLLESESGPTLLIDGYAGYGSGELQSDVNMNLDKIFIQPGFGLRWRYIDASINFRFSGIQYSDFDANGFDENYLRQQGLLTPYGGRIDGRRYWFFEPAFTVRGGYRFIKFQLQIVNCNAITNVPWNYKNTVFTTGFYFALEDLLDFIKER